MRNLFKIILGQVVVLILITTAVHAGPNNSMGIKVGLNIANAAGRDADGMEALTVMQIGGFHVLHINRFLAIQTEFLYSQKGTMMTSEVIEQGIPVTVEERYKLNYLEIPLLIKLNMPVGDIMTPNIYAGPAMGIKLSSKYQISATAYAYGQSASVTLEEDLEEISPFDVGLALGGGLDFHFGSTCFIIDARYTKGLTQIDTSEANLDSKNSVFSISAGLAFPLGQ